MEIGSGQSLKVRRLLPREIDTLRKSPHSLSIPEMAGHFKSKTAFFAL
jgi:hypothetical protein